MNKGERFVIRENNEHPCCWDAEVVDTQAPRTIMGKWECVVECQRNTAIALCEIMNRLHDAGELPDVSPVYGG